MGMRTANSLATSTAHHKMRNVDNGYLFESLFKGYGYTVSEDKHTSNNAPHLSVHYIGHGNCDDAPILHGHDVGIPSIAILQNIPISEGAMYGEAEPIVADLIKAAAGLCSTLPLAKTL